MIDFIKENKFLLFVVGVSATDVILVENKHNDYIIILIFISIIISFLVDRIGHVMQYVSLVKLTNSLEKSNLKLKKSEQTFRSFFTETNIPMCIFDLKNLKFMKVNKFLCDLLEYTEDDLIGMDISDLIYPEDFSESVRVANLNKNKLKVDHFVNRYVTKSGKIISIKWTFTNADEDGVSYCVAQLQ